MTLKHLRSSTANKRPQASGMSDGQLALNTASGSPGMFFKDSAGNLVKVGPVHVGSGAPNASPASGGTTGNSIGEQWLDTSGASYVFKVWDGSAWRSETGTFVDAAGDVMTGALGIIAGTASAPGLYVSGDSNTGIYSPGADQLAISTAGTGRLFVDASGNIGVGTNVPARLLTVNQPGVVGGEYGIRVAQQSQTSNALEITIDSANAVSKIYQLSTIPLVFGTNNTERLRISSDGKVGIGTSSPGSALEVNGESRFTRSGVSSQYINIAADSADTRIVAEGSSKNLTIKNNSTISSAILFDQAVASSYIFSQAGTERLRLTSDGKLGMGTSSPSYPFHLVGTGNYQARIEPTTNTGAASLHFGNTSGDFFVGVDSSSGSAIGSSAAYARVIWANGAYPLAFATNGTRAMTIDSSQRVGIGTTSPSFLIHATSASNGGVARFESSAGAGLTIASRSTTLAAINTASPTVALGFEIDGSERARLDTSGRLLVGTSTSPTAGQGQYARIVAQGSTYSSTGAGILSIQRGSTATSLDTIGQITFGDSTGGTFATIEVVADGTVSSASDLPGLLVFSTTADNASSPTERLRITSDGKVGIGTASPDVRLHVATGNATGYIKIDGGTSPSATTGLQLRSDSNGYSADITQYQSNLSLSTGGSERLRITSDGKVGIGTSSPSERLDLGGGVSDTVKIRFSMGGNVGSIGSVGSGVANGLGNLAFFTRDGSVEQERMRITGDGKVGIGTSAPANLVTIQSSNTSTTPELKLRNPVDSAASQYAANGLSGGRLLFGATGSYPNAGSIEYRYSSIDASYGRNGYLVLSTISTGSNTLVDAITIDTAQHVGIGTNPSELLHIKQNTVNTYAIARLEGNNRGGEIDFYNGATALAAVYADSNKGLNFTTNGTSSIAATIDSSGRVGINTSAPSYTLHTQGSIGIGTVGTSGSYNLVWAPNTSGQQVKWIRNNSGELSIGAGLTPGTSEQLRVDDQGRLLVGTSATVDTAFASAADKLVLASTTAAPQIIGTYTANTFGPRIDLLKSRGTTINDKTVVVANDNLGEFYFVGTDGTSALPAARINAAADGSPTTGSMPGRLVFHTTASGSSSVTERLRIDSSGTSTFTSAASTAPFIAKISASEVARIDGSGRLLVGTSASLTVAGTAHPLQIEGVSHAISCIRHGGTTGGNASVITFGRSRGTTNASVTAVADGDALGYILFAGANGSDFSNIGAQIHAAVDGDPFTAGDTTDLPGRLVFSTSLDGTASPTEQFRITNDGVRAYNQAAPAAIDVTGTATIANLKTGLITSSTAAAVSITLPTGTNCDGGFSGLYNNLTFEWSVINTGATNAVTILANTGHTIVGSATVAANNSGRFASRRTGTNTWVTYRLSS